MLDLVTTIQVWAVRAKQCLSCKKGQGLVEYALIIALIAIVLAASLIALRGQLQTVFSRIISALS